MSYRPNQKPFTTAIEGLATSLEATNGSLNPTIDGLLIRLSGKPEPWDMSRAWRGRELAGYTVRKTLWNKTALILFYVDMTSTASKLPVFSLQLKLPLTDEEIAQAADTYLMLLNLRRDD